MLRANRVLPARFDEFFASNEQHDAQEFLHLAMDAVDTEEWEEASAVERRSGMRTFLHSLDARDTVALDKPESFTALLFPDAAVGGDHALSFEARNPMRGMCGSSVQCTRCRNCGPVKNEWFLTLSLNAAPSLEAALNAAYAEGEIVDGYRCESYVCCGRLGNRA